MAGIMDAAMSIKRVTNDDAGFLILECLVSAALVVVMASTVYGVLAYTERQTLTNPTAVEKFEFEALQPELSLAQSNPTNRARQTTVTKQGSFYHVKRKTDEDGRQLEAVFLSSWPRS